jgi:hypothetical protein
LPLWAWLSRMCKRRSAISRSEKRFCSFQRMSHFSTVIRYSLSLNTWSLSRKANQSHPRQRLLRIKLRGSSRSLSAESLTLSHSLPSKLLRAREASRSSSMSKKISRRSS